MEEFDSEQELLEALEDGELDLDTTGYNRIYEAFKAS